MLALHVHQLGGLQDQEKPSLQRVSGVGTLELGCKDIDVAGQAAKHFALEACSRSSKHRWHIRQYGHQELNAQDRLESPANDPCGYETNHEIIQGETFELIRFVLKFKTGDGKRCLKHFLLVCHICNCFSSKAISGASDTTYWLVANVFTENSEVDLAHGLEAGSVYVSWLVRV